MTPYQEVESKNESLGSITSTVIDKNYNDCE